MTETIVDNLKTVDIEEKHSEQPIVVQGRLPRGRFEASHKERTIRQGRQRIVHGVMQQPAFSALPGRDVSLRAGQANRLAVLVTNSDPAAEHPAIGPVPVQDAMLTFELGSFPLEMILEQRQEPRAVFGMDPAEPLADSAFDFVLGVAQAHLPSG